MQENIILKTSCYVFPPNIGQKIHMQEVSENQFLAYLLTGSTQCAGSGFKPQDF